MPIEAGKQQPKRWVLVVDNQPDHGRVIEEVLAESSAHCEVVTVSTQAAALALFQNPTSQEQTHQEQTHDARTPDIVLLNMALLDQETQTMLAFIKSNEALRQIPTIIMTASANESDILTSYQQRCNCFVIKPQDKAQLKETLNVISSFWLDLVTLPLK